MTTPNNQTSDFSISVTGIVPSPVALPRYDLREPAFRKFEPWIAKAVNGSFTVDPTIAFNKPTTALAFVLRFKDAILAKKRYKYQSLVIPDSYPFENIKIYELSNGCVQITNQIADGVRAQLNPKLGGHAIDSNNNANTSSNGMVSSNHQNASDALVAMPRMSWEDNIKHQLLNLNSKPTLTVESFTYSSRLQYEYIVTTAMTLCENLGIPDETSNTLTYTVN